ncbi:MAG: recombinase family protein [Desulfobulbaceae bacterium]|nr:recombinase family protein [Desulfobulbaceae bacterium]
MEDSKTQEKKPLRCAIYTRVSTNDNLEREFTSLDSQRESGESYITSQKSEGWILSPGHYDDAGFTGANTDRPALQKLIADIKSGEIDCVVVYKVDRLSRSLLDFSQLLEFFDKNKVAFVSVTQHFNTNTSMGRLTLNILLSFAQFEREIISERTRDKMGAARVKGKWIGGRPPLGYIIDRENHKLVINPPEALVVKKIFELYLREESIIAVTELMNHKGFRTKQHVSESGRTFGGVHFQCTGVAHILKSVLYTGKVNYRGTVYPGEHEPMIDEQTFEKVQKVMTAKQPFESDKKREKIFGLLSGLIRCKTCNSSMYNTYANKGGQRYSYYCCLNASKRGYSICPTKLVNAHMTEAKVMECLRTIIKDPKISSTAWDITPMEKQAAILHSYVKTISYDATAGILEVLLKKNEIPHEFKVELKDLKRANLPPHAEKIKVEPQLRQNLILAHQIQTVLADGRAKDLKEIAGWLNMSPQRINQITNCLMLSPKIQEEILFSPNQQISSVPEYKLRNISDEVDWSKQHQIWTTLL